MWAQLLIFVLCQQIAAGDQQLTHRLTQFETGLGNVTKELSELRANAGKDQAESKATSTLLSHGIERLDRKLTEMLLHIENLKNETRDVKIPSLTSVKTSVQVSTKNITSVAETRPAHTSLQAFHSKAHLPSAGVILQVLYDGDDSIYVWGAYGAIGLAMYSISSDSVTTMGRMTSVVRGCGASDTDGNAYQFGGEIPLPLRLVSDILKFTPATGTALGTNQIVGSLPEPVTDCTAVWAGNGTIYVIGGKRDLHGGQDSMTQSIVKFSTGSYAASVVGQLPTGRHASSAVFDGEDVYIFGGEGNNGKLDEIVKFCPSSGGVELLQVRLPVPVAQSSAVWTGPEAYIVGGIANGTWLPMVKFNPETSQVTPVRVDGIPNGLYAGKLMYIKKLNRIYSIGGYTSRHRSGIRYIDLAKKFAETNMAANWQSSDIEQLHSELAELRLQVVLLKNETRELKGRVQSLTSINASGQVPAKNVTGQFGTMVQTDPASDELHLRKN